MKALTTFFLTAVMCFAISQTIHSQESSPESLKNGFKLSNLLIPLEEIRQGGPPRDGIPAIDRPQFMNGTFAQFLKDEDYVLGVYHGGVAKAYPIKIMDRHEVVNDRFKGEAVVVTYCPLCGSGIAFRAVVDGQGRSFGVSGLLYNSDVLLYDRETESLWSQIDNQAIAGPASGKRLAMLSTSFLSWGQWKAQYPSTLVLTTNTGYRRDYHKKAYQGYEESARLAFPVAHKSKKLKRKERVLGISINGEYKAYSVRSLAQYGQSFQDSFAGEVLWVKYDVQARTATFTNSSGEEIPSISLYWFAWYAFHPDTEIFNGR